MTVRWGIRLWVDDVRPAPKGWTHAKTSRDALRLLHLAIEISFDHDLGGDDTSMPVAREIERRAYEERRKPPIWHVHSANPVGRKNLDAALLSADNFYQGRRESSYDEKD